MERKRLTRTRFERFLDEVPAGTEIVMEAFGTAHYWGRRCQARGLAVRLLPPQYVRPYVRRNKTDRTDTEAVLEAAVWRDAACAGEDGRTANDSSAASRADPVAHDPHRAHQEGTTCIRREVEEVRRCAAVRLSLSR